MTPVNDALPSVLMVTPGFPPSSGGVEQHAAQLVGELNRQGVTVEVLTARRGLEKATVERREGLAVSVFPAWASRAMSISPRLLWGSLLAARSAEIVHVHSYHATTALTLLSHRPRARVFTPHYHGGGHSRLAKLLHLGYKQLGGMIFRRCDAVICVSEAERALLLADFPGLDDRIRVIPNGVDLAALAAVVPFAGEPPTVLSLGRLEPYKGVATVLRAFVSVPSPAQLVVIGDGSHRAELEKLARGLGIASRVRFLGFVPGVDVNRWLRTADVLVSMSEHEAFGMVPLEAAAAGARVVLSGIPAHREIVRDFLGDAAVVVPLGSPAQVTEAINCQMSRTGRVQVAVPEWSDVARRTIEVYRSARQHSVAVGRSWWIGGRMRAMFGPLVASPRARLLKRARAAVGRTAGSQRIGLLDRPWRGHWSALVIGPIEMPSAATLRSVLATLMEKHPTAALSCVADERTRRWVQVPVRDRERHLDQMVIAGAQLDLDDIQGYVDRYRPSVASPLPAVAVVGPDSIAVFSSHVFGDGATMSQLTLKLAQADYDGLVELETRAHLREVISVMAGEAKTKWKAWARWALPGRPADVVPEQPSAPVGVIGRSGGPAVASGVLTNAQVRELTRWRNEHCKGVAITSVLATALYRSLLAQGVPMNGGGFYSLFDVRRYQPQSQVQRFGNLAKSAYLAADMQDPASVDAALQQVIDTARVIPGLVAGAVTRALRPHGRDRLNVDVEQANRLVNGGFEPEHVTMTFSSMPSLPGIADLVWAGTGPRRYVGFGYPTGRLGISIFAIRLRDRMELSASFDRGAIDPGAVARALADLTDPARVLGSGLSVRSRVRERVTQAI